MDDRVYRITTAFDVPSDGPRVCKAGHFYAVPEFLSSEMIDPLIWPIVQRINASGWVWAAESCQGHSDATDIGAWNDQVDVMLRLVTHADDFGEMLEMLFEACTNRRNASGSVSLRCSPIDTTLPYREFLIYLDGHTVAWRARALDALARFAVSLPVVP